ncbi:hypothetical protein ACFLZZ_00095 [Nanoarchaeota archaeon]
MGIGIDSLVEGVSAVALIGGAYAGIKYYPRVLRFIGENVLQMGSGSPFKKDTPYTGLEKKEDYSKGLLKTRKKMEMLESGLSEEDLN